MAENTDEPALYSTATVTIETIDMNDNRPKFAKDVYNMEVSEAAPPGTKIGQIVAHDPDAEEFGDAGLVYQLFGSQHKG